ncbi:hypothetical protein EAD96_01015 [Micromonospora sp. BL1]|nr:hypothetical protein EAD96_01015 [Micromonospora sp. BL1]
MIDAAGRAERGGSSEVPRDRPAILQFEPPRCAIRAFCGPPKCKIGEEGGVVGRSCPKVGGICTPPAAVIKEFAASRRREESANSLINAADTGAGAGQGGDTAYAWAS